MTYTYLGRTGLQVSRLCLGTMNFGPHTSEEDSHAIMDKALDKGVNFFDTANGYGRPIRPGLTEEIIGKWFAQGGGRRERVVLATKVYGTMGDWPNEGRLSADHIDLYQMHHIDRSTPWEEIWQAMEQLVRSGKVIYVGSSNFGGWHITQANELAKQRNLMGLVSEQSLYNLTERTIELEVIPACESYGIGLIPYSPLAGGLLGGVLDGRKEGRRATLSAKIEAMRDKLEAYESLCGEIGERPCMVALAWLIHQPAVTAPIIGPRTMEQFTEALEAPSLVFTPEIMERLDTIFPGPGIAPEGYAW